MEGCRTASGHRSTAVRDMYGNFCLDMSTASPHQRKTYQAQSAIVDYIKAHSSTFATLAVLREKGWNNPRGDKHFRRQRHNADAPRSNSSTFFFNMMRNIGEQLHGATGAFSCSSHGLSEPSILDFCMAPGGFLDTALKHKPGARAVAFSLPPADGGHEIHLPAHLTVRTTLYDITMLAGVMGVRHLPPEATEHPGADRFSFEPKILPSDSFDIVLCDGQVLRTHARAEYREPREATRLSCVQIALGIKHMRPGGNMIVLLHKVESWSSVTLIQSFHKFSTVRLYKPSPQHAIRSSFYMVATNVQSHSQDALTLMQQCNDTWMLNTFGSDEDLQKAQDSEHIDAQQLLDEFGNELVRLGEPVWNVQARALSEAPFIQ